MGSIIDAGKEAERERNRGLTEYGTAELDRLRAENDELREQVKAHSVALSEAENQIAASKDATALRMTAKVNRQLKARITALESALRPFAEAAPHMTTPQSGDPSIWSQRHQRGGAGPVSYVEVLRSDFRRAAQTLGDHDG